MNRRRRAFASSITVSTVVAIGVACGNEINLDITGEAEPDADAANSGDAAYLTDLGPFPPPDPPDGGPGFLIENQPNVTALALDSDHVYWTTNVPDGGVYACAKSGCGPIPLLVGGRDRPGSLATIGGRVYWTDQGSGSIHWCRVDDCTASEPPLMANRSKGGPIALDDAGVYMLDGDDAGQAIAQCPYQGACKSKDNSNGAPPTKIATGADGVFFSAIGTGHVRRYYPLSNAIADITSKDSPGTTNLAVTPSGKWIYFVNEATSKIQRASPTGSSTTPINPVLVGTNPRLIAVDDKSVYWTSSADKALRTCFGDDCQPTTLVDEFRIGALAVDSSGVWFSSLDDGTIRHLIP